MACAMPQAMDLSLARPMISPRLPAISGPVTSPVDIWSSPSTLFPEKAVYYFCKPCSSRGLDQKILKEKAAEFNLIGETYISVSNAYQAAKENASSYDLIFIGGSTFVVSEIL